jgi:hypothetical protein
MLPGREFSLVRSLRSQCLQKLNDFPFAAGHHGLAVAEQEHIKVVIEQFA